MRHSLLTFNLGFAILLLLSFSTVFAQSAKLIPMRDFFKNPEIAYFQISPDGKFLSVTQPYESRMNIFVRPIGSTEAKRITTVKDRDISEYYWKGNNTILFLKDFGAKSGQRLPGFQVSSNRKRGSNFGPRNPAC